MAVFIHLHAKKPPEGGFDGVHCGDGLFFWIFALLVAGIELTRTANFVAFAEHFVPMRDPAYGARDRENHGKHIGWNAHRFQDNA